MRPSARLLDNDAYASRRQTEPACPLDEAQGTSMMTRWALRDHPDACMLILVEPRTPTWFATSASLRWERVRSLCHPR
jgi:hypothetical protein